MFYLSHDIKLLKNPIFGVKNVKNLPSFTQLYNGHHRERSGLVIERLNRDRGAAGSSLAGVTALCPRARHINPSLVLVQPRKTLFYITARVLMGRKESNQTNKNKYWTSLRYVSKSVNNYRDRTCFSTY